MPEPKGEQVVAALVSRLRGIAGDGGVTWHYTPELVRRCDDFRVEYLDPPGTPKPSCLYLVRRSKVRPELQASQTKKKRLELFVLAAKRWEEKKNPTQNPHAVAGDLPSTIQERLLADVEKRIDQDVTLGLGGTVVLAAIEDQNFEFEVEGWVVAEAFVAITYVHRRGEP